MENNVGNEINIENEEELRAVKPAGEFQLFVIIILIFSFEISFAVKIFIKKIC